MSDIAPVCVTGMHRSGTSLVARLLHLCGLDLGPTAELIPPRPDNPDGFWENRRLVAVNDALLAARGCGWDHPPPPDLDLRAAGWPPHLTEQAIAVLRDLEQDRPWGWKDPRCCLTLPFWRELRPDLRVVVCLRQPLAVARSLTRRNGLSPALGLHLWEAHLSRLLAEAPAGRHLVVALERLTAAPEQELERLCRWLGLAPGTETLREAAGSVRREPPPGPPPLAADLAATAPAAAALHERLRRLAALPAPAAGTSGDEPVPPKPVATGTPRLICIEIPGAADGRLRRLLERRHPPELTFRLDGGPERERELAGLEPERRRRLRLVHGYQHYGLHELLPGPSLHVALLRDPVARIAALHDAIRRNPSHPLHRTAAALDLAAFARSGLLPELDNGQVRRLAGLRALPCGACGPEHLELARRRLREDFALVGLVERPEESLLLLARRLGWPPPRELVSLVEPPRPPLDEATRAAILRVNELDAALHAEAGRLLDEGARDLEPDLREELDRRRRTAAPEPRASIIVLCHNAREVSEPCLAALRFHTGPRDEIVVVDNGSTDGTGELLAGLAAAEPRVRVITSETNLGFAAGNNLGLAAARGRHLVLLNSDVAVTPGWLDRLLAVLERRPGCGLVGPVTNRISGPQQVPVAYDQRTLAGLDRFAARVAREEAGRDDPLWRLVGFCLLLRREVVERIGGLDERFGQGNFEDDDYCLRALLAGFGARVARDCFVHHWGGASFRAAGIDYGASLARNWELFRRKWGVPAGVAPDAGYDLRPHLSGGFDPARHVCPLPGAAAGGDPVAVARRLLAAGRPAAAAERFRAALRAAPDDPRVRLGLARALWGTGDAAGAVAEATAVLRRDPTCADAVDDLGRFLQTAGHVAQAVALYRSHLRRVPGDERIAAALAALTEPALADGGA